MNSLILKPTNPNIFLILRRFSTNINLPTDDKKHTRDIKIPELKKDKEKRYVKDNYIHMYAALPINKSDLKSQVYIN